MYNNDSELTPSEIHDLALVYAHAKVLSRLQSDRPISEADGLNLLVRTYETAIRQIPSEQKRQIVSD